MATAGAAVDRLLRRLASDAVRLELPTKTGEELSRARRTLTRLQDLVAGVDRRYFEWPIEVQEWMRNIIQIACDMEDLLDEFEDQDGIGSQRSGCIAKATSFCSSNPFLLDGTIENRMKTLRKRLDFLSKDSVVFSLMQHSKCDIQQSDILGGFDGAAVIGRDDDKEKIKNLFFQNDGEMVSIISIVGLVGSGKTTLARLIFNDQGEGWNFNCRIWVYLNRNLDLKHVVTDIVSQANQTEGRSLEVSTTTNSETQENLQSLKISLKKALHDKSCLIVLDGLCSTDKNQLNELKEMLRGTNKCIKILVTTYSKITAELMHTNIPPYALLPLSEEDCWRIFSQKAFADEECVNACLMETGKKIVQRCEGIPALAHFLGSIMHNQVMDDWLAAKDEEMWKLERRFSSKIEVFSSFNQIYCDMPSALKLCFLYFSLFPKGSGIDKEKLIWQWIALEMVGSKHGTFPSYVHGEMYIQDLLSVHFLEVRKATTLNEANIRTARTTLYMHNFVHEFSSHVAYSDTVIWDDREMQSSNAKRLIFQYALLTYYREQSTLCSSLLTRARALHCRNSEAIKLHREAFELLKHLRVLNLNGCCIGELPASIGHLKHLRYLDVSDLKIQTFPSSVSILTNLEALDLSKTCFKKLPSFIGNFSKLKYLNLQGCEGLQNLPQTIGHLQRLEHLRLSCCYEVRELDDSLCNLYALRFLDLSSCTELQQLPPSFSNLTNLEDLNLAGCFSLKQIPESFGNLYFLRLLNLSSCYELRKLPVSLSNLRKLEVLTLRRCYRLQNLLHSFGNIQYLRLLDLAGCEELQVISEILTTNLEYLNLQRCRKLHTQPGCFLNLTNLKFLNLSQCLLDIDWFQSLGYLFNLEYLNLSETVLDIPVSFQRLQKLHTLDLTGCVLMHPSSGVPILTNMVRKMTGLKYVLTEDPMIMASLPKSIRCSVGIDEHWHITTDELVIPDLTRGSRGLDIAERANLKNRLELCCLKLEWTRTSQPAADGVVEDLGEEILEKLQPNQRLEHLELVGYSGYALPTWLMNNVMTLLPNLVSLHLFCLGNCNNLPPLGHLRNLRYLHLKDIPNLTNLEMGLSGCPQPFRKLTHLKLETLLNLKELCILLSSDNENAKFMFTGLEELSVLSCPELIFAPSLPKCEKYEIRDSNRILSCGQPLGPSSSPSPTSIEISGCRIPSSWLLWLKSLQTLEKAVFDACVGDDGETVTSFELLQIGGRGTEESSSSKVHHEAKNQSSSGTNISHELTTQIQDGAPKYTAGLGSSIIRKLFPRLNTSSGHSVDLISSYKVSTPSRETPPTSHWLSRPKMSARIPNVGSLSLKQVREATKSFSPSLILGEGSFWTSYKAVLRDNQIVVVKRAKKEPNFPHTEVELLAEANHWSLVAFLGFIEKGNECIMIFEYVPNGTLRQHLHGPVEKILDFNQRVVIAVDVAIALTYLHFSTGETIICYGLKPGNILLTNSYRAKVHSDQLSRSGPVAQVFGTMGYADPEYLMTAELTAKSDVYSFGVVLLEIVSSCRPVHWRNDYLDYGNDYRSWALEKFNEGRIREILDCNLEDQVGDKVLTDFLILAFDCSAPRGDDRPSIEAVGERLWEIWISHRMSIGESHEYERSWAEFVEKEGILRGVKSMYNKGSSHEFSAERRARMLQEGPDVSNKPFGLIEGDDNYTARDDMYIGLSDNESDTSELFPR